MLAATELQEAQVRAEAGKVIRAALAGALELDGARANGLLIRSFPIESMLDACLAALSEDGVAARLDELGLRVIIGSDLEPAGDVPAGVTVCRPNEAAALATKARNRQEAVVYISEAASAGASGVDEDVLQPVPGEMTSRWYAEASGFAVLEAAASAESQGIRRRLEGLSVADLARFGAAVKRLTDKPHQVPKRLAEAACLPLIGLVPDRHSASPLAKTQPRWAATFDAIDGEKLANRAREAAAALKRLSAEDAAAAGLQLKRLLPADLIGKRDAVSVAAELAAACARFAEGDLSAQDKLPGLSNELLKGLRRGEAFAADLVSAEPVDGDNDEGSDDEDEQQDVTRREDSDLDDLSRELKSREEDWSALELETESEEPINTLRLVPAVPPTFVADLASRVGADLWRRGGWLVVEADEPFLAEAPSGSGWPVEERLFNEEVMGLVEEEIRGLLDGFFAARGALLASAAALAPQVGDPEEETEPDEGDGVADAVMLVDAYPLLVARKRADECRAYVEAYAALAAAVATSSSARRNEYLVPWLTNLDLAIRKTDGQAMARLLPMHPLRIERALLHLELSGPPPPHPASILADTNRQWKSLSSTGRDRYVETNQVDPTLEGVVLAAELGFKATWALLARRGLCRAVRVELRDLDEPAPVLAAIAGLFSERAAEVGGDGAAHLEVVVTSAAGAARAAIDPEGLSEACAELLEAARGRGPSMSIEPDGTAGALPAHLCVTTERCKVFAPSLPTEAGADGVHVEYEPGEAGNIWRVSVRGAGASDAKRALDEQVGVSANPPGVVPPGTPAIAPDTLVQAVAARGGWPVDPAEGATILAYEVDKRDNFVAVLGKAPVLDDALDEAFQAAMPTCDVAAAELRRGALKMHGLRGAQLRALTDAGTSKLKGDLGQIRAFLALEQEAPEALIVDLDCPAALEWAKLHDRLFGSQSRPDLLVLEPDADGGLARLRLVELKARKAVPSTKDSRAKLAAQAVLARARLLAAFDGEGCAADRRMNAEGLRRIAWLEAGRQRKAKSAIDCLRDLDARLEACDAPEVTTECWIVPEQEWDGELEFVEETTAVTASGQPDQERVRVHYRVLQAPPAPTEAAESGPPETPPAGEVDAGAMEDREPRVDASKNEDAARERASAKGKIDTRIEQMPREEQSSAAEAPADLSAAAAPHGGSLKLTIGATWEARLVAYEPDDLPNRNLMVTGSSGMGKTQLLKSLIWQIRDQDVPVIVLDFKNDYASDEAFCEAARLERVFVRYDGLPYNPLMPELRRHPRTGEALVSVTSQVQGLAATLRATYGLGVQQENKLKDAMRAAYEREGINPRGDQPIKQDQEYPDFAFVGDALAELDEKAYSRLDPLFDLGLFRPEFRGTPFEDLLGRAIVLDLSDLPSDSIKAALARIFIISAHGYFNSQKHAAAARQFFVFDEAHRMKDEPKLEQFARECRAYGVGILLSSQLPSDFKSEVSAQLAMKIAHGNGAEEDKVKGIVKLFDLKGSEAAVSRLDMFEVAVGSTKLPATFVRTLHYPARAVLKHLEACPEGLTEEAAAAAPGLDPAKTSTKTVLEHLESLGLAERGPDDLWRPSRP